MCQVKIFQMFNSDLETLTRLVTEADDLDPASKRKLIQSLMSQLRSLKAAVNLNTHFLILGSILE